MQIKSCPIKYSAVKTLPLCAGKDVINPPNFLLLWVLLDTLDFLLLVPDYNKF